MNEIFRKISKDRLIIFICFCLAVFLWFSSQLSKTISHPVELKVVFRSAEGMALASELPSHIEVTASGTGWSLLFSNLKDQAIWAFQLPNKKELVFSESDFTKKITHDFKLETISLSNVSPAHLFIKQDILITKNVPLLANISILPKVGFVPKDNYSLYPAKIKLTGPAGMLSNIDNWSIGDIDLIQSSNQLSVEKSINLNSGNSLLEIYPDHVAIGITFEEITEKTFIVPISIDTFGTQIDRIFPKEIKVKIQIGLSKFNQMKASDFKLGINLDSINTSNTYVVNILQSPPEVVAIDLSPTYVDIYFKGN